MKQLKRAYPRSTQPGRGALGRLARQFWLVLVAIICLNTGCEAPELTQTQAFEYAEEHYRDGQYDAALDGYQAFLNSYPTSPLAATVEMRIRTIHREVRSVMMKKDVPRPRYLGDAKKHPAPDPDPGPKRPADRPDKSPDPRGARHHESAVPAEGL